MNLPHEKEERRQKFPVWEMNKIREGEGVSGRGEMVCILDQSLSEFGRNQP